MPPPRISDEKREEFRQNGAVRLESFLDEHWLQVCREKFDWSYARPTTTAPARQGFGTANFETDGGALGTEQHEEKLDAFRELVTKGPFARAAAQLWGSKEEEKRVWYYDHELFRKRQEFKTKTGDVGRTRSPFHQDTPYFSFEGSEMCAFWICLDGYVPKESCLQVVKGSHQGEMYDLTAYHPKDDSRGVFQDKGDYPLKPIPNIQAMIDRGDAPEICAWELQTGDCVCFHLNALHGGAATTPGYPDRRTLVLRFFGEGATYKKPPFPPETRGYGPPRPWLDSLRDGDPYWQAGNGNRFLQVLGASTTTVRQDGIAKL